VEGNSGFNGTIGKEMNSEIIIEVLIRRTMMNIWQELFDHEKISRTLSNFRPI